MTDTTTEVLDPAIAAQHRAMPFTRLVDCGMDPADARALLTATAEGRPWSDTATDLAEARASASEEAATNGHRLSALQLARSAATSALFAQMAEDQDTPRRRTLYARYVALVTGVAELSDPALERVEVTYRSGRLVGWLCLPTTPVAAATVVVWGGLSGWGAAYLRVADALTARGIARLLAEGPGQGEPRLFDRLFVDADVAAGFSRFLDVVQDDPRLAGPIGVQGNSFGGLFAAHLASTDPRVAAVVVNGAPAAPTVPPFRRPRARAPNGGPGPTASTRSTTTRPSATR